MRLVFYGERSQFAREHFHEGHGEAPWQMFWPVCVLAAGTVLSGFLAVGFGIGNPFATFLEGVAPDLEASPSAELVITACAWTLGIGGGVFVWRLYEQPARVAALRRRLAVGATVAEHKFYWDEFYDLVAYRPAVWTAVTLDRVVERWIIGGSITGVILSVRGIGRATADAQTGMVRQYATVLVIGAIAVAAYFLSEASL
jgi:NADH-quinone oxidoreductase subunit L